VGTFIFDLSLPPPDTGADDLEVHWRSVPDIGGLAVDEHRVWQSVVELATVMRVRSKGKAKFSLKGVEESMRDGRAKRGRKGGNGFGGLEGILQQLSTREIGDG